MKRKILFVLALFFIPFGLGAAFQGWEKTAQPPAADFRALLPHPLDTEKLIVASPTALFEGTEDRSSWKTFGETGSRQNIERLLSFPEIPDAFFILTADRVSLLDLHTWKSDPVYEAASARVLCFAALSENPRHWFVGTSQGLFESDDAGATWFRFKGFHKPVSLLRFSRGRLFMASGRFLYVSSDFAHFKPALSLNPDFTDEEFAEEDDFEEGEPAKEIPNPDFYDVLAPEDHSLPVWAATRRGVYESRDRGKTWERLSQSGLRSTEIRRLVYSQARRELIAATPKGVYALRKNRWEELYKGLETTEIRDLIILRSNSEILIALTPSGIMQYPLLPDRVTLPEEITASPDLTLFHQLVRLEPSANELFRAVNRYANVRGGKIKRWQTASRISALLPSLSFGKDFSVGNNIDIDRGGTNDPDKFIYGPPDKDRGWNADVNWDFGDLLYSTAQTSIDNREKLMVELRQDLLSEATRIYFERRRLQTDILMNPAPGEQEHLEKLLRVDELSALLDGMTRGYFGNRVAKIYEEHPEFNALWDFHGQGEVDRTPREYPVPPSDGR